MMKTKPAQRFLASGVLLALTCAACGSSESEAPTTSSPTKTPSSVTSSPSVSPSASVTPSASSDSARAGDSVVAFWVLRDKLGQDPKRPLTALATVARGQALKQWQRNLTLMRGKGTRQVGSAQVTAQPGVFDKKTSLYVVTACVDVSKVNVVDKAGKSVVPADRPPRMGYDYKVQKDGDDFFVVEDLLEGKPC